MTTLQAITGSMLDTAKAVTGGKGASPQSADVASPPLPEPTATWSDATTAALAALAEFFKTTREGMREVKKAFDASRQAEMRKEVEAMREEASEIRKGAIVQAATQAVSAYWGAESFMTDDQALAAKYKWAADCWGKMDGPAKSVFDARAKDCQADAAGERANAERAKTTAEDIQSMADTQAELASKAMDAIRALLEARHAAAMGILSQRG